MVALEGWPALTVRKILKQERGKESRAPIPLSTLSIPWDVGSAGVACHDCGKDPDTGKEQRISCSDPFKHTIWTTGCGVGSVGVACCDRGEDPEFVEQQELIHANYHYYL
jgi:hypothetical protein